MGALSLIGPGGVGNTRLALGLAEEHQQRTGEAETIAMPGSVGGRAGRRRGAYAAPTAIVGEARAPVVALVASTVAAVVTVLTTAEACVPAPDAAVLTGLGVRAISGLSAWRSARRVMLPTTRGGAVR